MKRILTAIDLGPSSPCVIRDAVELARAMKGTIRLLYVVDIAPQVRPPGVFVPPMAMRAQELVQSAERELAVLEESIPSELRDGALVEIGHPSDHVCEVARSYDADLVVIGAHQYGRIARALGTTAARIVNRIDRPVFVARALPREQDACAGEG